MQERGKREIPEKTLRPASSSGTTPTCENPAATPLDSNPVHLDEASSLNNNKWILFLGGATVAERIACSPPTKVNRVHSPAGSLPDFRMWDSCQTLSLAGGGFIFGDLPFPRPFIPAPLHTHLNHPHRLSRSRC
ncbi:hypothetical protein PR048_027176 [Dryococelus australis]|uniref:Uncharacterized protein n=1 Tax=Dryococelus australis TaxID=614101 RepID=A0ABQ9GEQ3_9NEOP|nr:hypothetical protein PR048_027176 [Dryococelus australis]